jgi:hypothetical protein
MCVTALQKHIRFENIKTIWTTNRTCYKFSLEISWIATCDLKFRKLNVQKKTFTKQNQKSEHDVASLGGQFVVQLIGNSSLLARKDQHVQ